jgi:23S rRNA pseudoU1915 N3-methylase RlmH
LCFFTNFATLFTTSNETSKETSTEKTSLKQLRQTFLNFLKKSSSTIILIISGKNLFSAGIQKRNENINNKTSEVKVWLFYEQLA